MKKHLLTKTLLTAIIAVMGINLFAQVDIILDPSTMEPADTGYYVQGVWKDKDNDGIDEFYNECVDEYGDSDHREAGVQQGFTYNKAMLMPTCFPKDAIADPTLATIDHAEGYIELTKSKYPNTDSASLGYIITPSISNLVSLNLELSPDNTPLDSRPIAWFIDYSTDGGATWEDTYVESKLLTTSKTGESFLYDGSVSLEFDEMKTVSKTSPIVLRIMSKPLSDIYTSQRLKVHYVKVVADLASSVSNNIFVEELKIRVIDNIIISEKGVVEVFNILGRKVGSGKSISVDSGIYIVKNKTGNKQKVLVN